MRHAFERLTRRTVEQRPSAWSQVGFDNLSDHVVGNSETSIAFDYEETRPAGGVKPAQYLFLRPQPHTEQNAALYRSPSYRSCFQYPLPRIGQRCNPLPDTLCDIPRH
jgi:hypothetical protein